MTKQPPYVSKLRLSRICRWLMALGVVKLCIFGALVAGYPLPELSWDILRGNVRSESADAGDKQGEAKPASTLAAMDSLLAPTGPTGPTDLAGAAPSSQAALPTPSTAEMQPALAQQTPLRDDPQGAAAARAAAALGNTSVRDAAADLTPKVAAALAAVPIPAPTQENAGIPTTQTTAQPTAQPSTPPNTQATAALLPGQPRTTASAVADTSTTQAIHKEDKSWWSHVMQLKALPFPRMGLDQVAHAATLDSPPPPSMPAPSNTGGRTSAFTPPAQIPSGLNADGSPIAPRSTTAQPRPAGTSGPQFDENRDGQNGAAGSIPSMLTPTSNVPAPRTDVYVAPEDPNRKQQELARREQEVLVLKQQMEQRLEELQAAERKVQGLLDEAKDVEAKKISRLSAIYVNMKPKQAAKALESMEERTAVKILAGMSPKQSGEILTYADPKKTAKFTEIISRMRSGQ